MPRRFGRLLALVRLGAAAIASLAVAQLGSTREPQPVGSARLNGRVVADDNGAPVRRAYVSLFGVLPSAQDAGAGPVSIARHAETDDAGRCDFADLPAGSYRLDVAPMNGFVPSASPRVVVLTTERTLEMAIRLDRTGAIAGRIADESGDLVLGATVHALRRNNFDGYLAVANPGSPATIDDLGQFRIFNLPPGEYYVVATYRRPRGDPKDAPRSGYASTYYPGFLSIDDARPVVVRAGQDSASVNFTLAPSHLATVVLRAVDSRGSPSRTRGATDADCPDRGVFTNANAQGRAAGGRNVCSYWRPSRQLLPHCRHQPEDGRRGLRQPDNRSRRRVADGSNQHRHEGLRARSYRVAASRCEQRSFTSERRCVGKSSVRQVRSYV